MLNDPDMYYRHLARAWNNGLWMAGYLDGWRRRLMKRRAAVFLDRDDTLIACRGLPAPPPPGKLGDLVEPSLVRLLPGVREGCEALAGAGFVLVIVSNQGCVARGGGTIEQVERVNARVCELLGGVIHAVYYCPFHPQGLVARYTREHAWRKPNAGMLHAAADALGLDLARSYLIGDATRDIEAGLNAGLSAARCYLLAPEGKWKSFRDVAAAVLGNKQSQ